MAIKPVEAGGRAAAGAPGADRRIGLAGPEHAGRCASERHPPFDREAHTSAPLGATRNPNPLETCMALSETFRPTLLVGVGGTGCDIAEQVYRQAMATAE